ncbi:MAG: GWxTD domain-containing protein, partial [Thermoanaerobaculia bacterium]|nr:GWxTD domain-containing protein [Thermoanaerobaculia bacterium]
MNRRYEKVTAVGLLLAMLALPGFGRDLGKWTDWDQSPQALFMTEDEKRRWAGVATAEEAERFVQRYMARRGSGFRKELERRIRMADRYLGTADRPGSETIRGEVVILLGAPTRMERSGGMTVGRPEHSSMSDVYTNVGPAGAGSANLKVTPVFFTYEYSGDEVRERLGREKLVLKVRFD